MLQMSDLIPEIGYAVVIPLFLLEKKVLGPQPFRPDTYRQMLAGLPQKMSDGTKGRTVGLGEALLEMRPVVADLDGKTTFIIVSDGSISPGVTAVEAARQLLNIDPAICFDTISLAESAAGRAALQELAGVNNCVFAEGRLLLSGKTAMQQFVEDVFFLQIPQQPGRKDLAALDIHPRRGRSNRLIDAPPFKLILFNPKSSDLNQEEMMYLVMNLLILKSIPDLRVRIEGHTDNTGNKKNNRRLSRRRARTVYDELVRRGIRANRMKIVGYGESMPAVSNLTDAGQRLNRRVEIVVDK